MNQAHTTPNSNQMQAEIPTLEQVQAYASEQQAVPARNGFIITLLQMGGLKEIEMESSQEKPALSPEKAAIYFSIHAPV